MKSKLRTLRADKGLTQSELAKKIGVTFTSVGAWENGRRVPTGESLCKMADFFGVSTDYILGRQMPLSEKEVHLLLRYRQLSPEDKTLLLRIFDGLRMLTLIESFDLDTLDEKKETPAGAQLCRMVESLGL